MSQARTRVKRFSFGPYELDVPAGELCKNGRRIHAQGHSFEVLVALLEHPGELVTRRDLQQRLWPEGVSVDFDNSLNSAVNRLRQVLRDGARNPKYIETLHHRGYRFIGPRTLNLLSATPSWASGDTCPALRLTRGPRRRH